MMTIAIILWLLFMTAFTIVIRSIRTRQMLFKSSILREMDLSFSPVTALLGVELDDKGYMRHIERIREQFGEIPILLLYKGPEWKAEIMQRKLPSGVQVMADEGAERLSKLELMDLPSYLITDQTYRIRKHSRIFDVA